MAKGKKKARKTVKTRACASGRAFAKGARKGKCVPTKPVKGCWARSRKAAAEQLHVYDRRKASALHMQAKVKERKEEAAKRRAELQNPRGFFGLGGRRRRRRHHR